MNKHRTNKKLCDLKHEHLPKAIRNNIPMAMGQKLHGCFWDDGPEKGDIAHTFTETQLGLKEKRTDNIIAESHTVEFKKALSENPSNPNSNNQLNARQTFQFLKQSGGDTLLITPPACWLEAPDDINVYTDGS